MRRLGYLFCTWLAGCACSQGLPPPNDGGTGGGSGGGTGNTAGWTFYDLDTHAKHLAAADAPLAIAVDSPNQRIGVAYFVDTGVPVDAGVLDAGLHDGTNNWEIHYLEWQAGVVSHQAVLKGFNMNPNNQYVQRPVGLSLAFQPNGEPAIAYMGGDGADDTGMSNYWFQSDPEIQYRSGGTTWTEQVLPFKKSADIINGDTQSIDNGVSNTHCTGPVDVAGFLLGLFPAITIDSQNKTYYAFRDCHNGQFPQQDWGGSALKLATGVNGAGWAGTCVKSGGDDKGGWGGHTVMVLGQNELPAMISDTIPLGPDNDGSNVIFTQLQSNGTWSNITQISNATSVQSGAALAYEGMEGYGIAWADVGAQSKLYYTHCSAADCSPSANWQTATPVFGSGTGGWYPSLAIDPVHHEPAIAFYVCSNKGGQSEGTCGPEDELDVIQRISGNWQIKLVDDFGQVAPITDSHRVLNKIGFFGEKRFVVYLPPTGDSLRLAVEK